MDGCKCSYGQAPGGYNMPVQVDADGNLFVVGHSAQPLGTQSLGEAISWNAGFVGQAAAKYCRLYTRASQYAFESGGTPFRSRELTGVNIFYPYTEIVASGGTLSIQFPEPTKILPTVDIKVSGYADGAGTVTSALRGFLVAT